MDITITVQLKTFNHIKEFCEYASQNQGDVSVMTTDKKYIVDGKSILGMLSICSTDPVIVNIKEPVNKKAVDIISNGFEVRI